MTDFNDVMVDIETTGTNPERHGIIQIAAVKFNLSTGQVDPDVFDRCLRLHPGREWDFDTRCWWVKQGNILQEIEARAEDPYTVIRAYYDWLLKDWPVRPEGRQFWSKPVTFDYNFLTSYLKMFGLEQPCHYRYARDMNSFMAGLTGDAGHPEFEIETTGSAHDALSDVLNQIKLLLHAKQMTTQGVIIP